MEYSPNLVVYRSHLVVRNVPSLGATNDLIRAFENYGTVQEHVLLDEYPSEPFTDTVWIRFQDIHAARVAKRKLDDSGFLGQSLNVSYAPESESINETKAKLQARIHDVRSRLVSLKRQDAAMAQAQRAVPADSHPFVPPDPLPPALPLGWKPRVNTIDPMEQNPSLAGSVLAIRHKLLQTAAPVAPLQAMPQQHNTSQSYFPQHHQQKTAQQQFTAHSPAQHHQQKISSSTQQQSTHHSPAQQQQSQQHGNQQSQQKHQHQPISTPVTQKNLQSQPQSQTPPSHQPPPTQRRRI
eukprot:c4319_g1_i2.p1 GENE.c4319_g1_i2~~c4319_g1_i2.p1  ORF type:complete len:295 (-),score=62.96 c4319_g1_i2:40-924(-)